MFNNKRRLASAWAKGLMLGKAVGARDERDRIIALLDDWQCGYPHCDKDKTEVCYPKHYLIQRIKAGKE